MVLLKNLSPIIYISPFYTETEESGRTNENITFIRLQFIHKTSVSSTLDYKQEIPLNYTPAFSVD